MLWANWLLYFSSMQFYRICGFLTDEWISLKEGKWAVSLVQYVLKMLFSLIILF